MTPHIKILNAIPMLVFPILGYSIILFAAAGDIAYINDPFATFGKGYMSGELPLSLGGVLQILTGVCLFMDGRYVVFQSERPFLTIGFAVTTCILAVYLFLGVQGYFTTCFLQIVAATFAYLVGDFIKR